MTDCSHLNDKSILITGGTGSFGRRFVQRVLASAQPKKLIILSRDEWKQWDMQRSDPIFQRPELRFFLGDVRDKDRLLRAFDGVDYVIHAAALKHVPIAEYNPSEFVKTNVNGAMNVVDAAIDCGVKKVIALSTDKAVSPVNLYGATKLCSDKLFVGGTVYVGDKEYPKFSIVRYGNVLASRGSIVPLWQKMVADGAKELPVTDERMTRFWITLDQAVDFVIDTFPRMAGGETFVPKIPSMRIVDLAEAIAPDMPKKICGIREGEKLHEILICPEDTRHTREFSDHYAIYPQVFTGDGSSPGRYLARENGQKLEPGFIYSSDKNTEWLDVDELRDILGLNDCNSHRIAN